MKSTISLTICILITSQFFYGQGKLDQVKKNLNSKPLRQTTSTKSSSTTDSGHFVDLFIEPLIWITINTLLGETQPSKITPYPYYSNQNGEYTGSIYEEEYKTNLLKLTTTFVTSKTAIKGGEVGINYRFNDLLGAEFRHTHFYEKYFDKINHLDISSLTFNYFRVRERHVTASWALGATYVANEVNRFGITYAIAAEVFPIKPISCSFLWKQSFINSQAINTLKLQLHYHLKNTSVFAGYHNYVLAHVANPSLAIGLTYRH